MALLLETSLGDVVVDLDIEGSPSLCKNVLKLAKARQFTQNLVHHVSSSMCKTGCPRGNGMGGASVYAYLDNLDTNSSSNSTSTAIKMEQDVEASPKRFLKSSSSSGVGGGHRVLTNPKTGDVVALCINGVADTIGSQFGIILRDFDNDTIQQQQQEEAFLSLGRVAEDSKKVLEQVAAAYCDAEGRPFVDIRIQRALIIDDPFEDPPGLDELMTRRGIIKTMIPPPRKEDEQQQPEGQSLDVVDDAALVSSSPYPDRPDAEVVEARLSVDEIEETVDEAKLQQRQEEALRNQDRGRAVVLEMLGDLPDAEIRAPEDVLFVCKLNPATQDEDLELIFSRFDSSVKAEIIRDADTGNSLQYAFVEFSNKQAAVEAYFKMNNALVDDRRIKVDFSQSVAKIWDKYRQRLRVMPKGGPGGGNFGGNNRHHPTSHDTSSRGNFCGSIRNGGGGAGGPRHHNGHSGGGSAYQQQQPPHMQEQGSSKHQQQQDRPIDGSGRGREVPAYFSSEGGEKSERDEFGRSRKRDWDRSSTSRRDRDLAAAAAGGVDSGFHGGDDDWGRRHSRERQRHRDRDKRDHKQQHAHHRDRDDQQIQPGDRKNRDYGREREEDSRGHRDREPYYRDRDAGNRERDDNNDGDRRRYRDHDGREGSRKSRTDDERSDTRLLRTEQEEDSDGGRQRRGRHESENEHRNRDDDGPTRRRRRSRSRERDHGHHSHRHSKTRSGKDRDDDHYSDDDDSSRSRDHHRRHRKLKHKKHHKRKHHDDEDDATDEEKYNRKKSKKRERDDDKDDSDDNQRREKRRGDDNFSKEEVRKSEKHPKRETPPKEERRRRHHKHRSDRKRRKHSSGSRSRSRS